MMPLSDDTCKHSDSIDALTLHPDNYIIMKNLTKRMSKKLLYFGMLKIAHNKDVRVQRSGIDR